MYGFGAYKSSYSKEALGLNRTQSSKNLPSNPLGKSKCATVNDLANFRLTNERRIKSAKAVTFGKGAVNEIVDFA